MQADRVAYDVTKAKILTVRICSAAVSKSGFLYKENFNIILKIHYSVVLLNFSFEFLRKWLSSTLYSTLSIFPSSLDRRFRTVVYSRTKNRTISTFAFAIQRRPNSSCARLYSRLHVDCTRVTYAHELMRRDHDRTAANEDRWCSNISSEFRAFLPS